MNTIVPGLNIQPADRQSATQTSATDKPEDADLRAMAQKFEASFISQMLKHSGLPKALQSAGGQGTDAFSVFYIDQLSTRIADQGGFGIADNIYEQLAKYEEQGGN
ncbi:rod-binding protein [Parvularcula sp. IMCC14364]|uniref:rod-binding protein n=1 Tax=Parvularcula sp. IMCC14364 TaxID=3067902 RepID=UPI0027409611|nr:rod-binding protein [Parvularcula sp. IMCC14364]